MTPPSARRSLVELIALCGLAFTQPLLELFGRTPDLFVLRGAGAPQIVAFAVAIALLPATVLWLVEMLVRWASPTAHLWVHQLLIGALVGVIAVQVLRQHVIGNVVYVVAAVIGGLAVSLYRRSPAVRTWVGYLAWAPVGFVALFLLTSPTSRLLASDPPVADVTPSTPAPVVVIILDELPLSSLMDGAGDIDRDLYPNLAALADDAHWFRNATSVSPGTYYAVPAILTGQMPEQGKGPSAADHPESLFTLLGGSYDVHAEEAITHLCPAEVCPHPSDWSVLGDLLADARDAMRSRLGLQEWADPIAALTAATDPAGSFEGFVDELTDDPMGLQLKHVLLPHRPYRYLPDGADYPAPSPEVGMEPGTQVWSEEAWPSTLARQRLILQTQRVDDLLGRTFDRLRALGTYDDAAIVVTADHGVSLDPGTVVRPIYGDPLSRSSSTDMLWVPLFVKEPGQTEGDVSDVNALTVDVVPTIADILGVDMPWDVDGRSLLGPARPTEDKPWRPMSARSGRIEVGAQITIDGAAGFRDLFDRTLDEILPTDGRADAIWRVGPRAELVGQKAAALVGTTLAPLDVELLDAGAYGRRSASDPTPSLVRAHGEALRVGDLVAVSVDGTIAATGVVFEQDGRPEVAVMVDPERLGLDGSTIEVYRIS